MNKQRFSKLLASLFVASLLVTSVARAAPLLDIVVLMDGSGSISVSDFEEQRSAVSHLFDSFTIGATDTRFSLFEYSTSVTQQIGLSGSALAVNSALAGSSQSYGQTNHGGAFAAASAELDANARAFPVHKVVLLLTDGETNEPVGGPGDPLVYAYAEAENLKSNGALIFTLGFGSEVDPADLADFSSGEDYSFLADDFEGGITAIDEIVLKLNSLEGSASAVDAPPAIYLLSMGLLGLMMRRRRRVSLQA